MFLDVPEITHTFLTTGHTQMPVDSMHSRIETQKQRALKSGPVYIPAQWVSIIKLAKKNGKPYTTTEMDTKDFFDLSTLCNELGPNFNVNEQGEKFLMGDIVEVNVKKEKPFIVHYKTDFSQPDYKTIDIRSYSKRNKTYPEKSTIIMKQAYTEPPKISIAKKQDLLSLCHSNLIPDQYHEFYDKLSTENKESTGPKSSKNPSINKLPSNIKKVAPAKKNSAKKTIKKKLF